MRVVSINDHRAATAVGLWENTSLERAALNTLEGLPCEHCGVYGRYLGRCNCIVIYPLITVPSAHELLRSFYLWLKVLGGGCALALAARLVLHLVRMHSFGAY